MLFVAFITANIPRVTAKQTDSYPANSIYHRDVYLHNMIILDPGSLPQIPVYLQLGSSKVGFFEVVTPLLSRGVVFARDSPYLLSLFGKKSDITGKTIILGVRKTLV
eukprot:sb/3477708/